MKDLDQIKEFFSKSIEEAMGGEIDEQLYIKVSPEDKIKAFQIFQNNGYIKIDPSDMGHIKRYASKFGSDVYASNSIEDIYDFYYDLAAKGIRVEDENVTDIDYDVPLREEEIEALDFKLQELFTKLSSSQEIDEEEGYSKYLKDDPEFPGGKTPGLTSDVMSKILMKIADPDNLDETAPTEKGKKVPAKSLKEIVKATLLEKKKKRDRCLRIADRKFDKPSAYKSGAATRCRQGEIWKNLKEETLEEKEKETLRTWFKRKGAPGKTGGWVDCNSPIYKNGKKVGYKPCGRSKGETRSKYPSCRPTAAKCSDPGKGKKWGKTK
jgi:hypothetical protein